MKHSSLKILLVGSEAHRRRCIVNALERVEGFELVSTAASRPVAMARLQRMDLDLVILDLKSGENEELETLAEIHKKFPGTAILVTGDPCAGGPASMVKALEMGAVDFIDRPTEDPLDVQNFTRQLRVLGGMLKNRMNFRQARPASSKSTQKSSGKRDVFKNGSTQKNAFKSPEKPSLQKKRDGIYVVPPRIDAVAIGISTGGPNALMTFIPGLRKDLGVPVFLVQHMPKRFTAPLAESLNKRSSLTVKEAEDNETVVPGTVYIAQGGRHMAILRKKNGLRKGYASRIVLNDDPPVNSCRPSVDVLFSSVAQAYGRHVLAVVMTGMGGDGMMGARDVRDKGGYCISQSDDSCVVYGMPRAVNDAGIANESVPLNEMANRVMMLVRGR